MNYRATVSRVTAAGVMVRVPVLAQGYEFGPMPAPPNMHLAVNDPVVVGNIAGFKEDLVILAHQYGVAPTLDDLSDVLITSPGMGDLLSWDGAQWVNSPAPDPSVELDDLTDVVITSPATGSYLKYDGADWVDAPFPSLVTVLDDLSDVVITGVAANHKLRYDGANWVNVLDNLDSLSDVVISGVAANHKVRYNGSNFVNVLDDLDSLSDVVITTVAANHKLRYNGSNWVNVLDNIDSLSDVVITAAATGHILRHDGSNFVNVLGNLDSLSDAAVSSPATGQILRYNGTNFVNTSTWQVPTGLTLQVDSGAAFTIDGKSAPRGYVFTWANTSTTSGIGTGGSSISTGQSVNLAANRAYKVTVAGQIGTSLSTNRAAVAVSTPSNGDLVGGWFGPQVGANTLPIYASNIFTNTSAKTINPISVFIASSTGTMSYGGDATNPRYVTIEDIGASSDFPTYKNIA